ncbi:2-oxoacid:acceptor oxidoreductase subunit alpha [Ornithobacterium rhinotracheale]|uniref:2-oxoacid:acceptor oxidoreductase subunit alpha n=1 Tax=Ornithobacterium rhinotracheale TaxID=28251 RepID=UPI0016270451|nr:2-oxoacid:acceptor oxidoreductase subunit alpha [Ornithobacterium rhinotracheale]MRJ10590.1 2-oxoacid:acceptor oxidoreductase subunit alpha [Ornithobacterium rhinotracheale]
MKTELKQVVILFAGDSGDGMQLTGSQFTNTSAHIGNDISTFPDFPAEIRAPGGTIAGVSGFQLHFGSVKITSPGDGCDVLVAMNAAALIKNQFKLKPNGIVIANTEGFNAKNLRLAKVENNPLDEMRKHAKVYEIDITQQTNEVLKNSELGTKDKDRTKNMFALGFVYWLYSRPLDFTIDFLKNKFGNKPEILDANIKVLKAGYHFGEISDTFTERFEVKPAQMPAGKYRNITGNHALAIGLVAAAQKAKLDLFYGGYPITPASDILHHLAKYKNLGVKTFQAEDEIAAMASVIGASYAGNLAVTASSGPGIALKTEAIGLAIMLELPAVIVNVQRGGPSTGLPTKTEQADLLQAVYGRNGEAPLVVVAAKSPRDCFQMAYEACRLALEHMTPVMLLSDGYLGNGSEPWKFPTAEDLQEIKPKKVSSQNKDPFLPYLRDENGVRDWATPGMPGLEHRVGGLEKQNLTGDVSYNPDNHEFMVKQRAEKIRKIQNFIPLASYEYGNEDAEILILGWGSTYGSILAATPLLAQDGISVAHVQLNYICPFPKNLGEILAKHKYVIIPEINQGQLVKLIRDEFLVNALKLNKTKGTPFTALEIYEGVKKLIES